MKSNLLWLRRVSVRSFPWLPTALMAAVGAIGLMACAWSWAGWRNLRSELEERVTLYRRYGTIAQHQAAIESTVKAFGPYLATSVSDDAAVQQLMGLVEHAAQHTGVQITGLKPRPSQRTPHVVEYAVELECSASMDKIAQFIHALEYGPALLRVDRLRINPAPRTPQLLDSQLLISYTTLL